MAKFMKKKSSSKGSVAGAIAAGPNYTSWPAQAAPSAAPTTPVRSAGAMKKKLRGGR